MATNKIGYIVKKNTTAEKINAVGFVPRDAQLKVGKNGVFKTFTLGVYTDENGETVEWYNCTCDQDQEVSKGQWLNVTGETWVRHYTNRKGEKAKEHRIKVDTIEPVDVE